MSHVATVDVVIKDLEALKVAVKALGLEWREGKKTYKWYGRWVNDYSAEDAAYRNGIDTKDYGKCDHAIGVPGNSQAYEIGVCKAADGTYKLAWDFYAGGHGLMKHVSAATDTKKTGVGKLVQGYAAEVAAKQARKQGFTVKKVVGADGKIRLKCTK